MTEPTRERVAELFAFPGFIREIGVTFVDAGPRWCETSIAIEPRHLQHTGVVHAGVMTTLADHTAGGAVHTLLDGDRQPLTVEFKVHFLRAARGSRLECRGEVLKPGSRVMIAESVVHAVDGSGRTLVAKLIGTFAPTH